ncbi:MAG: ABC transporter permease [Alphaproteobacteria bacterium]
MTDQSTGDAPKKSFNWARELERYALLIAWVLLILFFSQVAPDSFLTWSTFSSIIFGSQAVLLVLTLALIIPLTAGDFDLSVAAVLTFSAMLLAILNAKLGWPLWGAFLVCLGMGLAIGLINAFFILFFRIHSLIVTLGTASIIQGMILWVSGSQTLSGVSNTLIEWVIVKRFLQIPMAFYYAIILAAIIWYVFEYTSIGRRLLFVGRGREVARLSGISVTRVRAGALVASAMLASLAGIINGGTTGGADPLSGLTFLLPAFAAAFLGATAIIPGRFNPVGSVIAVFFLVTGITGLNFLGVDTFVQNIFNGAALIVAVSASQLVRGREEQGIT